MTTLALALFVGACQGQAATQPISEPTETVAAAASELPAQVAASATELPPTATDEPPATPISPSDLQLSFTDPSWDGVRVPDGQQCNRAGGENPATPSLRVANIPAGANAIVLEFSDRDYGPMDNGGHGKFGLEIEEGTNEIEIESVPGHTFDLPQGFFLVQEHQAPFFDTPGAYMPPCSGGAGNSYYLTVKAVELQSLEDLAFTVLEQGVIELGKY